MAVLRSRADVCVRFQVQQHQVSSTGVHHKLFVSGPLLLSSLKRKMRRAQVEHGGEEEHRKFAHNKRRRPPGETNGRRGDTGEKERWLRCSTSQRQQPAWPSADSCQVSRHTAPAKRTRAASRRPSPRSRFLSRQSVFDLAPLDVASYSSRNPATAQGAV